MTTFKCYKHIYGKDVGFMPTKIDQKTGKLELHGYWVSLVNPENPFTISDDRVTIKNEDVKNWIELSVKGL